MVVMTITAFDFHVACFITGKVDVYKKGLFEKEGTPLYTYFLFLTLLAILGRAACWFRVLFIENQYFPFLRMQNELLLR